MDKDKWNETIAEPTRPVEIPGSWDATSLEVHLIAVRSAIAELTKGALAKALSGSVVFEPDDKRVADMPVVIFSNLEKLAFPDAYSADIREKPDAQDLFIAVSAVALSLKLNALERQPAETLPPVNEIVALFTKLRISLEAALVSRK
ncbi:MAG: hypothetical protein AAB592_00820 [Patescibacteria group bacterium]